MSNNSNNGNSGGVGLLMILQIVFVVLKFCNVITWNWWLVLIPLWINIILGIVQFVIAFFIIKREIEYMKWWYKDD